MARREELEAQTVAQLRKLAREAGLSGVGGMRKAQLVEALLNLEADDEPEPRRVEAPAAPAEAAAFPPRPLAGALLQIVSVFGVVLSVLVALVAPAGAVLAGRAAQDYLGDAGQSARDLAATVRIARGSLEAAELALEDSAGALRAVEAGVDNTDPLLVSVGELLGDELPTTIESTRAALEGAQEGAAAMDRVLRGLRLLGLDYDPDQPLDQSLAATSESLEPLPDSLRAVERELQTSRRDLTEVSRELETVGADLATLGEELGAVGASLEGYARDLRGAGEALDRSAELAPTAGWVAGGLMALLALTFGASQYASFRVGGMLRAGRKPVGGIEARE